LHRKALPVSANSVTSAKSKSASKLAVAPQGFAGSASFVVLVPAPSKLEVFERCGRHAKGTPYAATVSMPEPALAQATMLSVKSMYIRGCFASVVQHQQSMKSLSIHTVYL
jgi:hypothetical protein